jgi:hypothetical protein
LDTNFKIKYVAPLRKFFDLKPTRNTTKLQAYTSTMKKVAGQGSAPEPPKHMPAVKIPTIAGTLTTSAATPMAIANAVINVTCWVGAGGVGTAGATPI